MNHIDTGVYGWSFHDDASVIKHREKKMHNGFYRRAIVVGILAASVTSAAYAVSFTGTNLDEFRSEDLDNGGTISQNARFLGNITFTITTASASRSEIRRQEQSSGKQVMGGNFKLTAEGSEADKLSIIQVLTLDNAGATSGSAKPNEQLAIRRTGNMVNNKREWEFYLIQTSPQVACTTIKFVRGETVNIKMEYQNGQKPKFTLKKGTTTASCTSGTTQNVGSNRSGQSGRNYYGKLGVYASGSGKGSATVNWSSITD